ncbi:MAG: topoisomerase IA-like protein [Alphaproteobacteria bacterium]|jgi:topoisomerase IA-like protein
MSKLDKDTVVDNFTQAYTKANGKSPTIEAKGGWYSVDGGKNIRLAQLEEITTELGSAAPAAKAKKEAPAKKEAAAEKAPKKAAPKKAAAKKSPAKTFSVKDFYTQQILQTNPGAKAPR